MNIKTYRTIFILLGIFSLLIFTIVSFSLIKRPCMSQIESEEILLTENGIFVQDTTLKI